MSEGKNAMLSFRALQLANEHRNAHGLRYNDYTRYRNHCGNRTHRLRSSLKMTHGKGREFKKLPPVTLDNIKNEHLQLLLFEAERAWSYSQELYTSSLLPANKDIASKLRHRATARFRRAIHWCTQLLSHCQNLYSAGRLAAENMTEINAYTLVLSGRFLRYREEFDDGLDQLCVAADLLGHLARCALTSKAQALATFFLDDIAPEIRHCAHELGHEAAYDVDRIVKEVAPKNRDSLVEGYDSLVKSLEKETSESSKGVGAGGRMRLQDLKWEGQIVPVRNPELVDVLLRVQEAEAQLESDKTKSNADLAEQAHEKGKKQHKSRRGVAAFDAILAALSDAEDVSRRLLEAQGANNPQQSSDGLQDAQFLHAYIVYQLLVRRIERDLTLVSALVATGESKHMDSKKAKATMPQIDARVNPAVVKLLETTLQSLTQMRSLSIVEETPNLANAVDARIAYTMGQRCLYLARSYVAVKKFAEAVLLLQRSQMHIREASTLAGSETALSSAFALTPDIVRALGETVDNDQLAFRRDWFAYNGGAVEQEKNTSKKPLFFDIALNYVQLDVDRLEERAGLKKAKPKVVAEPIARPAAIVKAKMEENERPATPEPEPAARGGLTSLLGGWWGRK